MNSRPLRAVAEVSLGKMRTADGDAGTNVVPYLRAANVGDGALRLDDVKAMHFASSEFERHRLLPGDVLVTEASGSREQVGQTAQYAGEVPGAAMQNTLLRLRPREGTHARYLYWWSRFAFSSGLYAEASQGLGIWHLGSERMQRLQVPVLPTEEQRRIADFLDEQVTLLDRVVEQRREQRGLLVEQVQVLRDSRFLGLDVPRVRLRYIADFFSDGDWIESPYIVEEGIRLIQTGNIGVGRYKDQGFRYISEETFKTLNCTEVFPGDVLISRLSPPVGRAALAPETGERMVVSVDVAILRTSAASHAYLVQAMSTRMHLSEVDVASRGATMARVSRSQLGSFPVPMPGRQVQDDMARTLSEAQDSTQRATALIDQSLGLLRERKQALITAAVTGQFDVTAARSVA